MKQYLKDNTKVREDILNQKLFFELKEASARQKVHLKIHLSDVDIDGFDIIIDNNDDLLGKYQLKSRLDAETAYSDIHSIMLRPNSYLFDSFEFFEPIGCAFDHRGVILIDADVISNKIICEYSYLDIYILRALELGIFKINNQSKRKAEEHLRLLRFNGVNSNVKVETLDSLFIPVKDADSLLEIMGFNSIYNTNIPNNILEISKIVSGTSHTKYETKEAKIEAMGPRWSHIQSELKKIEHPKYPLNCIPLSDKYFDIAPLKP
ncbi:MAG: hypothetical protein ACK50A_10305 [Sphingobacteriaceae bacterium]